MEIEKLEKIVDFEVGISATCQMTELERCTDHTTLFYSE